MSEKEPDVKIVPVSFVEEAQTIDVRVHRSLGEKATQLKLLGTGYDDVRISDRYDGNFASGDNVELQKSDVLDDEMAA